MAQSTIENIEEKIRTNNSISGKNKTELLNLLAKLKPEMAEFSKVQNENAKSIAGLIERLTHEAMQHDKNPTLLKSAFDALQTSVKDFEVSHPQLVENVNYIANALSNMGI